MSFQFENFDDPEPEDDSDTNSGESDTSSFSESNSNGSEKSLPSRTIKRKRLRAIRKSFDQEASDRDEISDGYSTNGGWQPRDVEVKRRQLHHQRKERLRSPSPIHPWEEGVETTPPTQSQSSEKETDSQLPCSEGQDSQSEVDWESLLCDDIEMLESNWEAEFLVHQAQIMAYSDYKGLLHHESIQGNEDEPWHPYDPESILSDGHIELDIDSVNDELEGDKLICYGVIHKVGLKVLEQGVPALQQLQSTQPDSESLKEHKLYLFSVLREDKLFLLQPPTTSDEDIIPSNNIGVLNKGHTEILSELASFCTFEAYSSSRDWDLVANGEASIEKQMFLLADVILYGPKKCLDEVGSLLNDKKIFLQEPDYRDPNLGYMNPHMLNLSAVHPEGHVEVDSMSSFLNVGTGLQNELSWQVAAPQSLLKERIEMAFKNMTRAQNLKRIPADIRILTILKSYQEEALDFIMQRESGPVPEEYCLWKSKHVFGDMSYKHVITGCERSQKPVETGGGILADEMGLGKTLTMLSAMIRTTDEAKEFANSSSHGTHLSTDHSLIQSRATLVVVPSPLLLNEWMQEVKLHCDGSSNILIYHGLGREGNAKVLADSDIVLSTYHTISYESSDKNSPIWQIKWFRVILDEAHIIRRMSTRLFKTMKKLRAKLYWCLTGTPVQNSLEDLAALLSFIRASPLDDLLKFRKHVIAPLTKGSENGVENLRQLLDSVCLRRTKQLLRLPEANFELQQLRFSAKEEQQYNETRDKLVKLIRKNGLKSKHQKGYLGVLQLQLQLRRFCNHGTFQKASLGADEFDPDQAIALLKKQKIAKCEACSVNITGIQGIEETRSGSFTVCGHLLCMKCVPKMKLALKLVDGRDGCFQCSLCSEVVFGDYLVGEVGSTKTSNHGSKSLSAWQYFDKDGCSTKVSAVVADIEHHRTEGKSIIFSCWTRSLDLIGIFLTSRKIPFVRIDGSHSLGQRKWILENYQNDPAVRILLMTTGTGAVGLNLTVANCVYLLEPQWNPMVENQAIARVLRLGQTRNVRVVRYIMKGTVEEKEMRSQQIRKLEYAKVGWKEEEES